MNKLNKINSIVRLQFTFDYRKTIQSLNYFALKAGGQINKMKALKLIYFADRYHVRKYGRLTSTDNYVAMRYGPVPSTAKDIAESNEFLDKSIIRYSIEYIKSIDNLSFTSKRKLDKNVFSESDLEALQFAWNTFGHLNQFELAELTHEYPDWAKHKDALAQELCLSMNILDFLEDPISNVDKCFDLDECERLARRQQLIELEHVESLWR